VVSQQQLDENLAYVALGKFEGAELACGGNRLTRDTDGYFMAP
jgi:acyl-CoA reductase-like NAD-dependent aldehyde dehydrogenase